MNTISEPGTIIVCDQRFVRQTLLLRDLYAFLLYSGVEIEPDVRKRMRIGALKYVQFARGAREPTAEQWEDLDTALELMFPLLSAELRSKFLLSQFPQWIPTAGMWCLILALAALVFAVLLGTLLPPPLLFPLYLVWLASMGALGAIAFISMNLLSVQEDATFDMTSSRLLAVRIIVGSLFGVVLSLPFCWPIFVNFARSISEQAGPSDDNFEFAPSLVLFAPFILGFSTTLVILALNRIIDAVRAVFGVPNKEAVRDLKPTDRR